MTAPDLTPRECPDPPCPPIPASILIRPYEARQRFVKALRGLLNVFGYKRVSYRVNVDPRTLGRWLKSRNKVDYFKAIEIIAWHDRDILSGRERAELSENRQDTGAETVA